jgi:hypothetical protein
MRFPCSKLTLQRFNSTLQIKFFSALFVVAIAGSCWAQVESRDAQLASLRVVEASQKPQQQIDFNSIGRIKIMSRKSSYGLGELISVDVGLFNGGGQSIYFPRLELFAQISVKNDENIDTEIFTHSIPLYFRNVRRFTLLKPGNYDVVHALYILGCSSEANNYYSPNIESNSFVNRGRGCIDIRRPGKYTFTALIENPFVVVGKGVVPKTAIGSLKSEPFEITVE